MTMDPGIVDKITKLRRLATSSNVHEAAAAAAAADRLMQEHGIAEAELEAAGEKDRETPIEERDAVQWWTNKTPQWLVSLVGGLVRHYDCAWWISDGHRRREAEKWERCEAVHIAGRPSDIASVKYMYAWLHLEIERLAQLNKGNGRAFINSFRHGAVRGVLDAMYEEKKKVKAEAERTAATMRNAAVDGSIELAKAENMTAALVLVDNRKAEAKELRDKLHPDLRSGGRIGGATHAGGYSAGKEAGGRLGRQHKGLATGTAGRALKA